ncbi:hypothetical protein [Shewanella sp. Iso12]|uniref:hypothetical protein n=1 Tax=Shewanella sp. Iso12 TaxID=1826753 RepID=UPI0014317917|nr:hypothetical protein [Shewanella sp. Iso12]NJI86917.1 hypothetical protein [Shewanella sp. Iso12]
MTTKADTQTLKQRAIERLKFNLDEWPRWHQRPDFTLPIDGFVWSNLDRGGCWKLISDDRSEVITESDLAEWFALKQQLK